MPEFAVTVADVEAAAARLGDRVRRTPLVPLGDTGLLAKCESLQRTGSFKIRGATNAVLALGPAGVVTASSGNHGQALAAAARAAGIPCVVVMPEGSTAFKRAAVVRLGGEVLMSPPDAASRNRMAAAVAAERGLTVVPAYDHPLVIAGQGTVGLEIAAQAGAATAIVTPLGGGGLLAGVATAVRARLGSNVRIVGVEPEDGDDTVRSLDAGARVTIPPPRTICDGARITTPGELTFPIVRTLVDDVVAVTDDAVREAMRVIAAAGLVVEPTGALAVAGALHLGLRGAVCVLTGRNIGAADHAALLAGARD
jgi:threonine dehydratase